MMKQNDSTSSHNPNINQPDINLHSLKAISSHSQTTSSDIIALVQNKGKVILNDKQFILESPSYSDPVLQQVVNEPTLSIRALSKPTKSGECEYELKSSQRMVNVKITIKEK